MTTTSNTLVAGTYYTYLQANLAQSQLQLYNDLFPFNTDPNNKQRLIPNLTPSVLTTDVNNVREAIIQLRQVKDLTGTTLNAVDNNLTQLYNYVANGGYANAQDYYITDIRPGLITYYGF